MDFVKAYKHLSTGDIALVAKAMCTWHPAILGQMLLAVQAAKEIRYHSPHPDYYNALYSIQSRERAPRQQVARYSKDDANIQVTKAVRALKGNKD